MSSNGSSREVTIVGYVSAIDDDDAIIISTDEDNYLVELDELGEELADRLDSKVEVTGMLKKDKEGMKRIVLSDYRLLDDEEEEEYYDYDEDDEDERDY